MDSEPTKLDGHRGMAAQKATEERRERAEVQADQAALQDRQETLERHMLARPAATWPEAAERAAYLIGLFADTAQGRDPRRRSLVQSVLDDLARLGAGSAPPGQGGRDGGAG
ncbi:MAG TPA: hypothetical protein VEB20_05095 [Azospirillaceae bacterium]|nr:hypothetical protein [Azospirillaceae bacterium]